MTGTIYVADSSLVSGFVTHNELSGNYPERSDAAAFRCSYTVTK